METKPFALIGVNTNGYPAEKLKSVMDKENLNWRSFAEASAITKQWNLRGTPTLYVIDHKGVIRSKWLGSPGEAVIDAKLDQLVKEAQGSPNE